MGGAAGPACFWVPVAAQAYGERVALHERGLVVAAPLANGLRGAVYIH